MLFAFEIPFEAKDWVSFLVMGTMSAFIIGYIMRRRGFGLIGNVIVGILGALLAPFLYRLLPQDYLRLNQLPCVSLGDMVQAMVGAFLLLLTASFIRKRK